MESTEKKFTDAIVSDWRLSEQVSACMTIHREQMKKAEDLLDEIDTRLAYFEDFIKGSDGMEITKLRGKINLFNQSKQEAE